MTDKEYFDTLESYYSDKLKAGLKEKYSKCKNCSENKQFITKAGKLIYSCGSESGKCSIQYIIHLHKYIYYPETKLTHHTLTNMIDKSKHNDIFSDKEIKEYKEFIEISSNILKNATHEFNKINKFKERKSSIEKTHRRRINLKKEQNLLFNKINSEEDRKQKQIFIKEYIKINQLISDEYNHLHDECSFIDNFIITDKGSVKTSHDIQSEKTPIKETLGVKLNKNLIPELQDLVKKPNNNMIMNVIVAYRDPGDGTRKEQLKQFKEQMNLIFKDQTDIRIYIIEQEKNRDDYGLLPGLIKQPNSNMAKFNLGILKNIGFDIASKSMKNKKNAYYILSDVDLLPSINLIPDYLKFPDTPIHLGNKGTRYNMDGKDQSFLGGVISINKQDFIKANGYPNNFWGWGGEDNALNRRLKDNKINIYKSNEPVIDLEKLNLNEKLAKLRTEKTKEMRKIEKLESDKSSWKENGLSNLDNSYKITKKLKSKNITHITVFLNVDTNIPEIKDVSEQPTKD